MIYTVTLNPAIDNVIQTEAFQKGHINRACREYIFPGGKGVNVSLVLERLGIETVALGFLAGATGKAYQALLQENGLNHGFLFLDRGFTRINTKVSAQIVSNCRASPGTTIRSIQWQPLSSKALRKAAGVMPADTAV